MASLCIEKVKKLYQFYVLSHVPLFKVIIDPHPSFCWLCSCRIQGMRHWHPKSNLKLCITNDDITSRFLVMTSSEPLRMRNLTRFWFLMTSPLGSFRPGQAQKQAVMQTFASELRSWISDLGVPGMVPTNQTNLPAWWERIWWSLSNSQLCYYGWKD